MQLARLEVPRTTMSFSFKKNSKVNGKIYEGTLGGVDSYVSQEYMCNWDSFILYLKQQVEAMTELV